MIFKFGTVWKLATITILLVFYMIYFFHPSGWGLIRPREIFIIISVISPIGVLIIDRIYDRRLITSYKNEIKRLKAHIEENNENE